MENKSAYPIILDIERLINEHLRFIECFNRYGDYYYFVGMSMELEELNPTRLIEALTNAKDIEKLLPGLLKEENLSVIEEIRNYTRPSKEHLMNDLNFVSKLPYLMSLKKDYEKNGNIPKEILDEPCIMKDWYNALFEERIVKLFDKLRDYYGLISDHVKAPVIVEAKEPPKKKVDEDNNKPQKRFDYKVREEGITLDDLEDVIVRLRVGKFVDVNTKREELSYIFGDGEQKSQRITVNWIADLHELCYFTKEVFEKEKHRPTTTASCFLLKGKEIDPHSFSTSCKKRLDKTTKDKLDGIIKKLKYKKNA